MKKITFCLVCGATSPVEATRCQNCDAPLADKKKRRRDTGTRVQITPLLLLVALAIVMVVVAVVVHLTMG